MSVLYLYIKRGPFFELSTKLGKVTARIESELFPLNERSKEKKREKEKLQEQFEVQHANIR